MTKYRIIKAKSIKKEFINDLISNFQDWKEMREFYIDSPKGRYLEDLIKKIKEIQFEKQTLNPGDSTEISYTTKLDIQGFEEGVWISSDDCIMYFIKDFYIILQQPNPIFEKILRLKLEVAEDFALSSPFDGKSISRLFGILEKAKSDLDLGNIHVYRVIFHKVMIEEEKDEYLEFNIKKKEVRLEEIKKIEKKAARWHAFSIKVEIPMEKKPLKSVSLRFDRYGRALLYGAIEKEIDKKIAVFLAKIIEKL